MRLLPSRHKKKATVEKIGSNETKDPKLGSAFNKELDIVKNTPLVLNVAINRARGLVISEKKTCNPVCTNVKRSPISMNLCSVNMNYY